MEAKNNMKAERSIIRCSTCVNWVYKSYNMLGWMQEYCKTKHWPLNAVGCSDFQPSTKYANSYFLKELYENFISFHNIELIGNNHSHCWRLVDDGNPKRYKRISGNNRFYLRFNTEYQLDQFVSENKEIVMNAYFNSEKL